MHNTIGQRLFVAAMAFALLFSFPFSTPADGPLVAKTFDRDADPIIVSGASMPEFIGVPLDQFFVYAYRDSRWQQIPWQFDEVKDGEYIAVDNGQLDTVDELLAMGGDCGDQATFYNWIGDASARSHTNATKSRSWTRWTLLSAAGSTFTVLATLQRRSRKITWIMITTPASSRPRSISSASS